MAQFLKMSHKKSIKTLLAKIELLSSEVEFLEHTLNYNQCKNVEFAEEVLEMTHTRLDNSLEFISKVPHDWDRDYKKYKEKANE